MSLNEGKKERRGRILKWEYEVPVPEIPNVNFASFMLELMTEFGEDVAVVDESSGETITYKDMSTKIMQLSAGLKSLGIGLGDSVLLLSKNHVNYPMVTLGVILSEATCVPANPMITKGELKNIAQISEAKCVITSREFVPKIEEVYKDLGQGSFRNIWLIDDKEMGTRPSLNDLIRAGRQGAVQKSNKQFNAAKTVSLMPFSSGTTGLPKGVMLSHTSLLIYYLQAKYLMSFYPESETPMNFLANTLLMLPMFHVYGFSTMCSTLRSGGKLVIMNDFSPEKFFQTIEKFKITYSPIVPHIAKFMTNTSLMEKYDLSSLILFVSASSPITEETLEALREKTGKMAVQGYGMTETFATVAAGTIVTGSKADSVGTVYPYFEAKVINPDTGEILSEGEEGELCVRGPSIMLGYAKNPKATSETIDSEGWLHTGDVCCYDEENFLFITDRYKDLIKVKGFQVPPSEIENLLQELEEVMDVAVAGVPHERLGEAPRAWVVPAKGFTIDPSKLMKHVADRLATHKHLSGGVEVIDVLPRNNLGKVLRRQLRKSYVEATRSKL